MVNPSSPEDAVAQGYLVLPSGENEFYMVADVLGIDILQNRLWYRMVNNPVMIGAVAGVALFTVAAFLLGDKRKADSSEERWGLSQNIPVYRIGRDGHREVVYSVKQ